MRRFTHTFPQRISAFLLCLALCLGLLPAPALAADNDKPNILYVGNQNVKSGDDTTYWTTDPSTGKLTQCTENGDDWNVEYDPNSATLTLRNATIKTTHSNGRSAVIYAESRSSSAVSLTIELEGTNTIECASALCGIYVNAEMSGTSYGKDASLTITGQGSLDVSGSDHGIYVKSGTGDASLNINDASVVASSSSSYSGYAGVYVQSSAHATSSPQLSLKVNGGSLTASGGDGISFNVGSSGDIGATTSLTISDNAIVRAENGINAYRVNKPTPSGTGIVFNDKKGTVYGNVTLQEDLTIGEGESLTLDDGASLNAGNHNVIVDGGILDENLANSLGDSVKYAPTITTHPKNVEVKENETATFTVEATGSDLSYQWQQNMNGSGWTDITDETNTTYNTGKTTMDMSGTQYRCVVKNSIDEVTSDAATLTVQKSTTPIDPKYVRYIVEHYKQNADGSYTLADTEQPIDEIGKTVTATPKTYEGYTYNPNAAGTVVSGTLKAISSPDDIVTLKLYYDITLYTVTVNGSYAQTTGAGSYAKDATVTIDAGTRSGYTFDGWTSADGVTFANAGSAQTTFTMPAADTTITANWQYDPPYIPPSKPNWTSVARKLANAQPGDTVTVKMNGETEVPGEVWETIAGRDVTVVLDMGGNVSWTVDGNDVPTATHFADMDFGVDRNTTGIDVDVINAITGQVSSVQITLAHDGEFGFALTLTAPLGKENAGYWANLYHYDENAKTLNYETSAQVASDGTASLRMTHASQYAIVIDDKSHDLPFTDLGEGQWYESAVRYAYTHDIMEGMSATTFQPNGTLTRAQAVQIFYNLEGQPDVSDENLGYPYEDVNAQAWYGDAVYWARITGVASGYGDGTFQPGDSITRQEFAQMLYNYAKYKGYDLSAEGDLSQFPDSSSVADWAKTAMSWANGNQLINGHDDGTLEPGGTTTRAQAAAILMRFDQDLAE